MNTRIETDATASTAIAATVSTLRDLLTDAAARSAQSYTLMQSGERDRAIGVLLGLEAVIDDSTALHRTALALHRAAGAEGGSRAGIRPLVTGLFTPEDLAYVQELLGAEATADEGSKHLPGEMPEGIRHRIVVPQTEDVNVEGSDISAAQLARLNAYWSQIAGERVQAEVLDYAFIARCSELAALRLERKYNNRPKALAIESQNLGCWVFRLERGI